MDSDIDSLIGYQFRTGWEIVRVHKSSSNNPTGGAYSICFDVRKNGEEKFMKALDFNAHLKKQPKGQEDPVMAINQMTEQFIYERTLSEMCHNGHVTKVVYMEESGQEYVEPLGMLMPYFIFSMATYDLNEKLSVSERLDFAWKMKSLHDVAVALKQLHTLGITHQDVKPSNILLFDEETKLGDLGCSLCDTLESPFGNDIFPGDKNYAAPEKSYHCNIPVEEMEEQKYLNDSYLLGSLMVHYVTGCSMNALLLRHMPKGCHPNQYKGTFKGIEPYLLNGFQEALEEIGRSVPDGKVKDRLIPLIGCLCHPLRKKRVHGKNGSFKNLAAKHSLERFVAELDYIQRLAEHQALKLK